MPRDFDFVIFGASGFTGAFIAREISNNYPDKTIALAGRTRAKLEAVSKTMKTEANGILIADVSNPESLKNMASRGQVLINAVGPYRYHGLAVVNACVQAKTHYCDISGEPWFLEKAELDFDSKARENGVYCVSACGFDSIPSDMGIEFTRRKFAEKFENDKLNAVDCYFLIFCKIKKVYSKNLPNFIKFFTCLSTGTQK